MSDSSGTSFKQLMESRRLAQRKGFEESRKLGLVAPRNPVQQFVARAGQTGKDHPLVIGMRLARNPAMLDQDIDVEGGRATGDCQSSGKLRRGNPRIADGLKLEQCKECSGRDAEPAQNIGGGAVECSRGAHKLRKRGKSSGLFSGVVLRLHCLVQCN